MHHFYVYSQQNGYCGDNFHHHTLNPLPLHLLTTESH